MQYRFDMKRSAKPSLLDCPAVRYNWGVHDARSGLSVGNPKGEAFLANHFDPSYAAGYRAGLAGGDIITDASAFAGYV